MKAKFEIIAKRELVLQCCQLKLQTTTLQRMNSFNTLKDDHFITSISTSNLMYHTLDTYSHLKFHVNAVKSSLYFSKLFIACACYARCPCFSVFHFNSLAHYFQRRKTFHWNLLCVSRNMEKNCHALKALKTFIIIRFSPNKTNYVGLIFFNLFYTRHNMLPLNMNVRSELNFF